MKKTDLNSADSEDQKLIEDKVYVGIEDKGDVCAKGAAAVDKAVAGAKQAAAQGVDAVKQTVSDAKQTISNGADAVKQTVSDAKQTISDGADAVKNKFTEVYEEPVKKKGWGGWWAAALIALAAIGCCIYFATKDSRNKEKQLAKTTQMVDKPVNAVKSEFYSAAYTAKSGVNSAADAAKNEVAKIGSKIGSLAGSAKDKVAAAANPGEIYVYGKYPMASEKAIDLCAEKGKTIDYLYYFNNAQSSVPDNKILNDVAEKAKETGAEITITAYASATGSPAYNANLCEQRAENLENYLVAQGVSADHIKIVNGGQTKQFGNDAYCRRADIVVNYAG